MDHAQILETAATFIEQGFCKDGYAKDGNSRRVDVMSPDATCFCMVGAVARAAGGSVLTADYILDKWLTPHLPRRLTPWGNPVDYKVVQKPMVREMPVTARAWNDDSLRGQHEVVTKLREAAKRAKEVK